MNIRDVTIPTVMRTLERDARGFPIPFLVMRDRAGAPHFAVNDERKRQTCINRRLCAITGKRIVGGEYWFVGGPKSIMHPQGAFIDPPVIRECAEYALRVCPYLAARSYTKRVGEIKADRADFGPAVMMVDPTMDPTRPERFGMARCSDYERCGPNGQYLRPIGGWQEIRWWVKGVEVT